MEEKNILKNNFLDKITCLCFSGGGIKGLSFVGVLEKLIEKKIINIDNINLFVGTSAGSIISFLLNLNYNIIEIKTFVYTFNFAKLNNDFDCIKMFETFGINNGDKIKLLFSKFLESKFNVKDITFEELFNLTNKKLIIIGTNLTKFEEVVFSVDKTPSFSVIDAVRISISVPLIFTPVIINDEMFVDGCLVNNFPINHCPEDHTIGLYIKFTPNIELNNIQNIVLSSFNLACNTLTEKHIEKYEKYVIKINNPKNTLEYFDLTHEYKEQLLMMGLSGVETFISSLSFIENESIKEPLKEPQIEPLKE
jgi:predicted acylesterase/phospholipase RssA